MKLRLFLFACIAVSGVYTQALHAQSYPSKPIRFIVPFSAGGGADVLTRLLARHLSETWASGFVIDNRPGADGAIGTELLARSAPDGYTVIMITKLRAIAVSSPARIAAAPDVPTVAEAGLPGFEASTWFGILAPARLPPELLQTLHGEITKALLSSDVRNQVITLGLNPIGNTPEAFAEVIRSDLVKWERVIRSLPPS